MQDQIDENPSSSSTSSFSRNGASSSSRNGALVKRNEEEEGIECTGRSCQSCTAGVIADCVAVCCCPCALVDILAFTFLKVPYLMGRRWLTKGRMKIKKKKRKERIDNTRIGEVVVGASNGNSVVENEQGALEIEATELGNEEVEDNFSAEEEAWLELYRIGHLGFGRVSFSTSGSSSQRKSTTN